MTRQEFDKLNNEEALQVTANAQLTAMSALGHNKSARNEKMAELYEEWLNERGVEVPPDLYRKGVFNGTGTV